MEGYNSRFEKYVFLQAFFSMVKGFVLVFSSEYFNVVPGINN